MTSENKSRKQLYLQIADKVMEIIESRELKPHDPVPSEAELAKLFGVSRMTTKLALEQLVERGVVYRLPRRGTFLAGNGQEGGARMEAKPPQQPGEKKESRLIALVVPHMTDYTSRIIASVEHEVRKHGFDLVLRISKDEEDQGRCLQALVDMGIDGIILFPQGSKSCSSQVFKLKMDKIPSVIIDRVFYEIPIDCVYHDHFQGSYEMAKYLIAKGHREIGFSSNVIENITARGERYRGYIQALLDHGIPVKSEYIHFRTTSCRPDHIHEYDAEQGEFIRNNPGMTAVMCADDQVAIATLFSALHMNIAVPEKLSIVGFSDTHLSALTPVPLTTVRQDTEKLAAAAVELLMKRVRHSREQHITVKIQTRIIERKSVLDRSGLVTTT
ncbi:MAG: GntR family transcriptional regulator [Thermobacillus sp. ZCTH02-B1]|uniref:GntR family transcriptional regulator n=1 Tax=Thermobacillus sp. ZCTH02-B1 TaxID=1858795 RepID=UPI000B54FE05|nr:GntR family transcriptional regulator [Thermobacillus sp. ZCTH02-B1]OUM97230.1 MAG: GntR family transcriptional regulator [Thermobacillus sp. ZCTH02-B1]